MIPVRLSSSEKDAVVEYLSALNGGHSVNGAVAEQNQVLIEPERLKVGTDSSPLDVNCHVVGAQKLGHHLTQSFFGLGAAAQLAPNLAHTRHRIPRARLIKFIQDPRGIDPQTRMPKFDVSERDARLLADFILGTPLALKAAHRPRVPSIPLLSRPVEYEEIFEDVLGKICVHCHMDPDSNNGDGGAGNTGGLGFDGVSLNLETYGGLKRGLFRDGKWISITEKGANGEPSILWAALLRRHLESYRDYRPISEKGPGASHRCSTAGNADGTPTTLHRSIEHDKDSFIRSPVNSLAGLGINVSSD